MTAAGDTALDVPSGFVVREVHDGIFQASFPLATPLRQVNVWLFDNGEDWTIVDTATFTEDAVRSWDALIENELDGRPVRTIVLTHHHHDHSGNAGPLARRFGATVLSSRVEYQAMHLRHLGEAGFFEEAVWRYFVLHGCSQAEAARYEKLRRGNTRFLAPPPTSYVVMAPGDEVAFGRRTWRVMTFGGHATEHVCLYDESAGILIAGDQILPRVTPTIALDPAEPEGDPLRDYLASLEALAHLPDDTLMLPGHGNAFRGPGKRSRSIRDHHHVRLDRIVAVAAEPRTARDIAGDVFPNAINGNHARLAVSESLSHLRLLETDGRVRRHVDGNGRIRFQRT